MNEITVKKILNCYKHEKLLILSLNKEIEKLVNFDLTNEKIKKLQKELIHSNEFIKFIEDSIDNLSQPYKNVFYFRYIKNFSYEKISFDMNYSIQRIYQLHKEGLKKIFEKTKFYNLNKTKFILE